MATDQEQKALKLQKNWLKAFCLTSFAVANFDVMLFLPSCFVHEDVQPLLKDRRMLSLWFSDIGSECGTRSAVPEHFFRGLSGMLPETHRVRCSSGII